MKKVDEMRDLMEGVIDISEELKRKRLEKSIKVKKDILSKNKLVKK